MSDSPEQPSDEELSELIDDEENTVDSESGEPEGAVEVGIPPAVDDEGDIDSSEEMFSMDDFDSSEEVVEKNHLRNPAIKQQQKIFLKPMVRVALLSSGKPFPIYLVSLKSTAWHFCIKL
ncbi:MAG: hypothetical protein EBS13_04050 [Verrucomicrobia bacterium]|nr:hypothetical protein [Verrucomicrobiota bacterium]